MSLSSILKNDYEFKITIVNDGSTESGIKEYLRETTEKDPRLTLIENKKI